MFWTRKSKSFSVTTPSRLQRVSHKRARPEEAGPCQASGGEESRPPRRGPTGTDPSKRAAPQPTRPRRGPAAAPRAGGSRRRARFPQQLSGAAEPEGGRLGSPRDAASAPAARYSRSSERGDMAADPRPRRDLPAAAPGPRVATAHCHPLAGPPARPPGTRPAPPLAAAHRAEADPGGWLRRHLE